MTTVYWDSSRIIAASVLVLMLGFGLWCKFYLSKTKWYKERQRIARETPESPWPTVIGLLILMFMYRSYIFDAAGWVGKMFKSKPDKPQEIVIILRDERKGK
jgi:hypothetical protein